MKTLNFSYRQQLTINEDNKIFFNYVKREEMEEVARLTAIFILLLLFFHIFSGVLSLARTFLFSFILSSSFFCLSCNENLCNTCSNTWGIKLNHSLCCYTHRERARERFRIFERHAIAYPCSSHIIAGLCIRWSACALIATASHSKNLCFFSVEKWKKKGFEICVCTCFKMSGFTFVLFIFFNGCSHRHTHARSIRRHAVSVHI